MSNTIWLRRMRALTFTLQGFASCRPLQQVLRGGLDNHFHVAPGLLHGRCSGLGVERRVCGSGMSGAEGCEGFRV